MLPPPIVWEEKIQGIAVRGEEFTSNCPAVAPFLCIHGFLDNIKSFYPILPYWLRQQRHVVLFDLPGHGYSEHRAKSAGYDFLDWLPVVQSVVAYRCRRPVILVGHSLGAAIASFYASLFPKQVAGLILIDGIAPFVRRGDEAWKIYQQHQTSTTRLQDKPGLRYASVAEAVRFWLRLVPGLSAHNAEALVSRNLSTMALDTQSLTWRYDERLRCSPSYFMTQEQVESFLTHVQAPTLFVHAQPGLRLDEDILRIWLAAMPHTQYRPIPGPHHVHMESPMAIANCMHTFLQSYHL
jgi:pimeloyl-ACP methyl ester carboxylesterase